MFFKFLLMIIQSHHCFFVIFTTVNYKLAVSINHKLSFIIEVNLNQFCIETEQNTLFSFYPLFYVHKRSFSLGRWWSYWFILSCGSSIKILSEILHECNFFCNLSVGISFWSIHRNKNFFIFSLIGNIIYFSEISKKFTVPNYQYTF